MSEQLLRQDGGWRFTPPKSEAGERILPLPPFLVDALKAHRAAQLRDRMRAGPLWTDLDLVFPDEAGRPQQPTTVLARFKRGLERAGLEPMRIHDLRHGAATMLLAQGATHREIMAVLGHSSVMVSMNIYAHVAPDLMRQNAKRMQRALVGE